MYDRQLESFCGSHQHMFEAFKRSGRVISLCEIRGDSLTERLVEVEPQPDLATRQIDEEL